MFGNYNKLAYAVIGNVVAMLIVYLSTKGVAECVPGPTTDLDLICSIAGFTTAQITAGVLTAVNAAFVYFAPKNAPA